MCENITHTPSGAQQNNAKRIENFAAHFKLRLHMSVCVGVYHTYIYIYNCVCACVSVSRLPQFDWVQQSGVKIEVKAAFQAALNLQSFKCLHAHTQ